jgi:predicted GNAT family acetyltransferase
VEGIQIHMTPAPEPPTIIDNAEQSQFETAVDGHVALLAYHRNGKRLVLVHTEVPDELSGQGIGGMLVCAAIDAAATADLVVVPLCPFAQAWLQRHPETAERARIDWPDESPPGPPRRY